MQRQQRRLYGTKEEASAGAARSRFLKDVNASNVNTKRRAPKRVRPPEGGLTHMGEFQIPSFQNHRAEMFAP